MFRLLLVLLFTCLALPAMAAPRCEPVLPAAAAPAIHHGTHKEPSLPLPAAAHHDCIGCIAPIARDMYRPEQEPLYAADPVLLPMESAALARTPGAPEPPPPRPLA